MSSRQAAEIGRDIASILEEIVTVVTSAGEAEKAFGLILEKIALVNRIEQTVTEAMAEQSTGSRQILEAMDQITVITTHVRDSIQVVTTGSRQIRSTVTALDEVGELNVAQVTALASVVSRFTVSAGDPEPEAAV